MKRILTAIGAAMIGFMILVGCSNYHRAPVPVPQDYSMQYMQGCVDDNGNRAPDDFCDSPHPHYYSTWGPVGYMPAYGAHYGGGWTRQRPVQVNQYNTVIHTSPTGGTVTKAGTGSAVTSGTRTTAGQSKTPTTTKAPTPGITRGGLGVPSSSSSTATQSSRAASPSPKASSGSRSSSSSKAGR